MKNIAKIMTFKLSILSTLMLCVTANNYASDIEIYKAPNAADGKARVMLNLDNSGFMSGKPGAFSGNSTSIKEDYGNDITCPNSEKYYTQPRDFTLRTIKCLYSELFLYSPSIHPAHYQQ